MNIKKLLILLATLANISTIDLQAATPYHTAPAFWVCSECNTKNRLSTSSCALCGEKNSTSEAGEEADEKWFSEFIERKRAEAEAEERAKEEAWFQQWIAEKHARAEAAAREAEEKAADTGTDATASKEAEAKPEQEIAIDRCSKYAFILKSEDRITSSGQQRITWLGQEDFGRFGVSVAELGIPDATFPIQATTLHIPAALLVFGYSATDPMPTRPEIMKKYRTLAMLCHPDKVADSAKGRAADALATLATAKDKLLAMNTES